MGMNAYQQDSHKRCACDRDHDRNCKRNCNCNCNCQQSNCNRVLEHFHKELFEAFELFEESGKYESEALKETREAIDALKRSLAKDDAGEKIYQHALYALEHSGCTGGCNKDSCKCKGLEEQVTRYFDYSEHLKEEALCLLKEAAQKLCQSAKVSEEAAELAEDYSKCIHQKHCCH